jgi:hypothetical protein
LLRLGAVAQVVVVLFPYLGRPLVVVFLGDDATLNAACA